ncbi:hypothetical protein MAR_023678 [Mya arenaria]|uniref:Mitochondria-eating protein C-terminal domain-containing protein n=1 Tax=Mya arenaria TaxID=6604 RepID=A0ABY7DWI9_MYAAR|nr:hypothetical protein MAR_023678 [Mya arenaria]
MDPGQRPQQHGDAGEAKRACDGKVAIIQSEMCLRAIKPFTKRCIFIAWMMVVQTPPMCFDRELKEGATLDAARYRQYTSSGHVVHFLVWPALLLYRDGPIVCKGVAQGKKK